MELTRTKIKPVTQLLMEQEGGWTEGQVDLPVISHLHVRIILFTHVCCLRLLSDFSKQRFI
jgi:hypothetical protein